MKLHLCDQGDESVGIFPITWEVDCPFEKPDLSKLFTDDDIAETVVDYDLLAFTHLEIPQ